MSLLPTRKDRQSQQPAASPPTPRRKVSDDAAYFAQSILDLEGRCQLLVGQVTSWENQCNVMAVENKSLREDLRRTDARLEYFERRTTQLETKLKIVMDCLEEPLAAPQNHQEKERQKGSGDNDLPRVIADSPRINPATD